jgi:hypothetical protein
MANAPSPQAIATQIGTTNWLDLQSVDKLSAFLMVNALPLLPLGSYKGKQYFLQISQEELGYAVKGDGITPAVDFPAPPQTLDVTHYLMGIRIDRTTPAPPAELSVFYQLGSLVTKLPEPMPEDRDAYSIIRSGFAVVVNAVDSSLWLVYSFSPLDEISGLRHNIKEGEPWGVLAEGDTPFSMAKIANSVASSGLASNGMAGQEPWPIKLENQVVGGPKVVHIVPINQADLNRVTSAGAAHPAA